MVHPDPIPPGGIRICFERLNGKVDELGGAAAGVPDPIPRLNREENEYTKTHSEINLSVRRCFWCKSIIGRSRSKKWIMNNVRHLMFRAGLADRFADLADTDGVIRNKAV